MSEPQETADAPAPVRAGAVLVLYRPRSRDLERWLASHRPGPQMVAVDNAEQPDPALHAVLRRAGLHVLVNGNRGGLAGAYNRGLDWLQAQGCTLFFLFDQDSEPGEAFFERMLAACAELRGQAFIMGPRIHERRLGRHMPVIDPATRWPRLISMDDHRQGRVASLCVISSGSVMSIEAWRQLGAFREDYFIEYIDIEYALRAWHRAVPVYTNAAAVLEQEAGDIVRHGRHYSTHHPAWRRYYMARNAMHALREYPGRRPLLICGVALLFYQALGVARFETSRRSKLAAMLAGGIDGLRGRLGRLEDRHPGRVAIWRAR